MLKLTSNIKKWIIDSAQKLKGSDLRIFMAQTVQQLGYGGASVAERELHWNRSTIRKGRQEIENGPIKDKFSDRGRKKSEILLPNLLDDIIKIVDPESQIDPSFNSCRLYTRLTASEVRKRLLSMGYDDMSLPCTRTINTKLNDLNYNPKKVQKTKPHKKIAETDAIFAQVHKSNEEADKNPKEIRISIDAKAKMNIGNFHEEGEIEF